MFTQKTTIDSLSNYSFQNLADKFYKSEDSLSISRIYAIEYLNRAKIKKDTIRMADGYYFLTQITSDSIHLKYNDSIVKLTENTNIKNNHYPTVGFLQTGDYYYDKRNFNEALINYLNGLDKINKENNIDYYNQLTFRIGLIKTRYGQNEDALKLFKNLYRYYENKKSSKYETELKLYILFSLSDSYRRNKIIDSSQYFVDIGYKQSKELNNEILNNYFVFMKGILEFEENNIIAAKDSIKKALPYLLKSYDLPNYAYANYYLGKVNEKLNYEDLAIKNYKVVDSVFTSINDIHPDLRKAYINLIEIYKKNDQPENQLKYINRLLIVDDALDKNYKELTKNIFNKYDTPELIKQKNNLINRLKDDSYTKNIVIAVIGILLTIFLILLYTQKKKEQIFKRKFNQLLQDSLDKKENEKKVFKTKKSVPKDIELKLLLKLEEFEKNNMFLQKNMTIGKLAIDFKTNTKYLSATINNNKSKNFSRYIRRV